MVDQLQQILQTRREALVRQMRTVSLRDLEDAIRGRSPAVPFAERIKIEGGISIIAEMKRKSPSAGSIRPDFDPGAIATQYRMGGARAISVLTESVHFGGSLADLAEAKKAEPELPYLRKDFIFDPYQMAEARAAGADAVLLIADMLDPSELKDLVQSARAYGIEPLVEFFTIGLLEPVLESGAYVVGINNRNLRTLVMVPDNVETISRLIPSDRLIVAESGLRDAEDMRRLRALGRISAALIGESILKQVNLEKAVRKMAEAGEK